MRTVHCLSARCASGPGARRSGLRQDHRRTTGLGLPDRLCARRTGAVGGPRRLAEPVAASDEDLYREIVDDIIIGELFMGPNRFDVDVQDQVVVLQGRCERAASSRRWCGGGGRGGRGPRREPARLRHRRPGPRRCLTRSRARCREIRYCNASAGRPASSASSGTEPAVLRGPSRSSIMSRQRQPPRRWPAAQQHPEQPQANGS